MTPGALILHTVEDRDQTLHATCGCGRLTLHASAALLRLPLELRCRACGDVLAFLPA